jgi:hypothetical protein
MYGQTVAVDASPGWSDFGRYDRPTASDPQTLVLPA